MTKTVWVVSETYFENEEYFTRVAKVFGSEAKAKIFCDHKNDTRGAYGSSYDYEEIDVE